MANWHPVEAQSFEWVQQASGARTWPQVRELEERLAAAEENEELIRQEHGGVTDVFDRNVRFARRLLEDRKSVLGPPDALTELLMPENRAGHLHALGEQERDALAREFRSTHRREPRSSWSHLPYALRRAMGDEI